MTGVGPIISCCPALSWIWPQTTSLGCLARIVSRMAMLPRRRPPEETSTAPLGGEWVTSTLPAGQPASISSAWASVKSKLQGPNGVTGMPPPIPQKSTPFTVVPEPWRTVAAGQAWQAVSNSSSDSLLPGTTMVGLEIWLKTSMVGSKPRRKLAKSPAPMTKSTSSFSANSTRT